MGADTGEYHDLITHPGMRILPYAQEQCKTCHKDTMQGVTMDLLVYLLTAGIIRGRCLKLEGKYGRVNLVDKTISG